MALTRPKIWNQDTNIEYFRDPITVLHQGATSANVDVGFIFNRANGLVSNVALVWSESAQSMIIAYTGNTGVTDTNVSATSYANVTVGNISVNGVFWSNGAVFSSGSGGGGTTFTGGYVANQSTFGANLVANSGVASSSTITGAVVVSGGMGVSGNIYTGGNLYMASANVGATVTSPRLGWTDNYFYRHQIYNGLYYQGNFLSINSGTLFIESGASLSIRGSIYNESGDKKVLVNSGSQLNVANTLTSTSTTTGALLVAGGAGIAGQVTAGNVVTTSGVFWANGAAYSTGAGGGSSLTYTAAASPPGSPVKGDIWYNTTTDVIYTYTYDGVSSYWLDLESAPTLSVVAADAAGTAMIMGVALG